MSRDTAFVGVVEEINVGNRRQTCDTIVKVLDIIVTRLWDVYTSFLKGAFVPN